MLIKRIRILQKINETEDLVQRGGTIYPWGRGVTVDYPRSMVSHSFIPSRSNHYVTRIFRIERETWGSVLTFTCFIVMRWEFVSLSILVGKQSAQNDNSIVPFFQSLLAKPLSRAYQPSPPRSSTLSRQLISMDSSQLSSVNYYLAYRFRSSTYVSPRQTGKKISGNLVTHGMGIYILS